MTTTIDAFNSSATQERSKMQLKKWWRGCTEIRACVVSVWVLPGYNFHVQKTNNHKDYTDLRKVLSSEDLRGSVLLEIKREHEEKLREMTVFFFFFFCGLAIKLKAFQIRGITNPVKTSRCFSNSLRRDLFLISGRASDIILTLVLYRSCLILYFRMKVLRYYTLAWKTRTQHLTSPLVCWRILCFKLNFIKRLTSWL